MKKAWWAVCALALLGLFVFVTACSDDSPTSSLPPGDPADPDFQFVDEEVYSETFDGVDLSMELSTLLVDSIPGAAPQRPRFGPSGTVDGDIVFTNLSYAYADDWHVFDFTGYIAIWNSTDTVDFNGLDSIQILADGVAQQYPDSSTNAIAFRADLSAATRSGDATRTGAHNLSIAQVQPGTEIFRIDGDAQESITFVYTDTSATTCDVNVSNNFSASNIVFDFAQEGCPQSGNVQITAVVGANCTGTGFTLNVDGTWSVQATFDGVTETVTYNDGSNVWTVVDSCDTGGGPARGGW